jgi:hypothetical protein
LLQGAKAFVIEGPCQASGSALSVATRRVVELMAAWQGRIGKVEAVSGLEVLVAFDQTNAIEVRALFTRPCFARACILCRYCL